jgi:hypothetical protein
VVTLLVLGQVARSQESIPVIDLLVAYTPAAQVEAGPGLSSQIQALADDANTVLLNSRARARIRLIHSAKVAYTEPQASEQAHLQLTLDRLVNPADGHLGEVRALRDQYGADVAVLIVAGRPWFRGSAAPLTADAAHAFGVTTVPYDMSFVALLGRLLGCEAENGTVEEIGRVMGDGAFADSHAYRITNVVHGIFSTVMAVQGLNLPVFSNPQLSVLGQPLGEVGKADNVRTINLRAPLVAAFRGPTMLGLAPNVSWRQPAPFAVFRPGTNLVLEVDAADADGQIQRVDFFDTDPRFGFVMPGQQALATVARPPFRIVLPNAQSNWHRLIARATDDQGIANQTEIEFRIRAVNDDFVQRVRLNSPADHVAVQLAGMSLESGEPPFSSASVDATAWFTWTSPGDGLLRAAWDPSSFWGAPVRLRALRGSDLGSLTPLAGSLPDSSFLIVPVQSADVVQLVLGGVRSGQVDSLSGALAVGFFETLQNDTFATRLPLQGDSVHVTAHNHGARGETAPLWPGGNGPAVWWTWIPPESGWARIRFAGYWPRRFFSIMKGTQLDGLENVGGGSGGEWEPPFAVTAGIPLQIMVTSSVGDTGSIDFSLSMLHPPANDQFASRIRLDACQWSSPAYFPASSEPGEPAGLGPHTLWWEWTAPESGTVAVTAGYDSGDVSVFVGGSLAQLLPVSGKTIFGGQIFAAESGTTYQLVAHWSVLPASFSQSEHVTDVNLGYIAVNDRFADRFRVSGSSVSAALSNMLGTAEQGEPPPGRGSLWWSWKSASNARVRLWGERNGVAGQYELYVFEGDSLDRLVPVATSGASLPGVQFLARPGTDYQISLGSGLVPYYFVPFTLRMASVAGPENDAFENRRRLSGRQHLLVADAELATSTPGEPLLPGWPSGAGTVWWNWTALADGVLVISVANAAIGVYQRTPDGRWLTRTEVPLDRTSRLSVTGGQTYELMLVGYQCASARLQLEPRWANDDFAGRTAMPPWTDQRLGGYDQGTTQGATREPGEMLSATNAAGHSRWWTWRTPVPAIARLGVGSDSPIHVEQFRFAAGTTLERVMWLQVIDGTAVLRFHADPDVEYPLVVDSLAGGDANYYISLQLTPDAPAPGNDSFADAITLDGPVVKIQDIHRSATAEPGEPAHVGLPAARSLWWRWTAPETSGVRLRAQTVSLDSFAPLSVYPPGLLATPTPPRLAVYTGDSVAALTPLASSLPTTNQFESELVFSAGAGQTYALALDGGAVDAADVGEFTLKLVQFPTNDEFANRKVLNGAVARLNGTVTGATRPPNEWVVQGPSSWPDPIPVNVWWEWTAPADLRVTLRNFHPNHAWAVWRSGQSLQFSPPISTLDRFFGWEDTRRDFVTATGVTWFIAVYANPEDTTPVDIELEGVPVPANDNFANRILLSGENPRAHVRADNTSREPSEPNHGIGTIALPYGQRTNATSLWWSWTAPRSGLYRLTTSAQQEFQETLGPWDTIVRADCIVYQGAELTGLTRLAGTEPDSSSPSSGFKEVTFTALAGHSYEIAVCPLIVERRVWDTGKFFVDLAIDPVPQNSSADEAIELSGPAPAVSGNLRAASNGLWWRWTAPDTGRVALAQKLEGLPPNRRLLISVYRRDEATGNRIPVDAPAWVDSWQRIFNYFEAQAGQTYWFNVSVLVEWSQNPADTRGRDLPFFFGFSLVRRAVDNDAFARRMPLTGPVVELLGDNTGATRESGEPLHQGLPGRGSLWWTWTAPGPGQWTLAVRTGWSLPLLVGIYRGDMLTSLAPVQTLRNPIRNDLVFQAQGGETFAIAVDNPGPAVGVFQVDLLQDARPANDDFARRAGVTGLAPTWTTSNLGATAEPGEPAHAGVPAAASVWWSWTSPATAVAQLTVTQGDYVTSWGPPGIAIYVGDSLTGLTPIAVNRLGEDRSSILTIPVETGVTYHMALDSAPNESGTFRLQLSLSSPPANDAFARRIMLLGSQAQATAVNVGASIEAGEPNPAGPYADATLWWSWTAPASGWTTIDTAGSSFDTRLALYQGSTLGGLSLVAVSDDEGLLAGAPLITSGRITFNAQGGTTYQIQVGSVGGGRGQIRLAVIGPDTPPAELVAAEIPDESEPPALLLRGTPGQTVWIQFSEDLLHWVWAGSLRFEREEEVWLDPLRPFPMARFYRIVLPP